MKIFTKKEIILLIIIGLSLAVGAYLYPNLPERVPSHWNFQGEIDGWSSRNFSVFFFPLFILGVYLLMTFIPLIDPLRKNYEKFRNVYFGFKLILVLFFVSLYVYSLLAGIGVRTNMNYFILPAISIMLIAMGIFLPRIKRNWFVGIKTPWTIHSDEVWEKTHRLGGRLFIIAGAISLGSILIADFAFAITIASILTAAFVPVIYSYFIFRRMGKFEK